MLQKVNSPARISFNRNGEGQISCRGKTYEFSFSTIAISKLKNSDYEIEFRTSKKSAKQFIDSLKNEDSVLNQ